MRVIAGSARGTKLLCPDGLSVRPTHDRVKEALFSMITDRLLKASVLDLFAGTGALGIEALSRGASEAFFVDASLRSLQTVEANLDKTHLLPHAHVIKSDYLAYLSTTDRSFDLIFLDPPYKEGFLIPALKKISERKLLKPDGLIYCETEGEPPEEIFERFSAVRDKKYGRVRILLLKELSI